MNDLVIRAVRTAVQLFNGWIAVALLSKVGITFTADQAEQIFAAEVLFATVAVSSLVSWIAHRWPQQLGWLEILNGWPKAMVYVKPKDQEHARDVMRLKGLK